LGKYPKSDFLLQFKAIYTLLLFLFILQLLESADFLGLLQK